VTCDRRGHCNYICLSERLRICGASPDANTSTGYRGHLAALCTKGIRLFLQGEVFRMNKDQLAFEQQQMRERWAKRPSTTRAAIPPRAATRPRAALPGLWKPATPKSAKPTLSVKPATGRNQNQEQFALGFSIGVPPVRAGYSTATIEYACVCGIFSINPNKCPRCGRKR
jgi:hypothetical protein